MPLSRREFLIDSLASGAFLPGISARKKPGSYPFQHGVASGDPLQNAVIIWTRITPQNNSEYSAYRWRVALDPAMANVVAEEYGVTGPECDHTIKIDVTELAPATTYYYAFETRGHWSDVGKMRTLPEGHVEHLRIAYTSCSNYAAGYFNVYREIAARSDLDLVLHLGDYIYEYASIEESLTTGRVHCPLKETVSLDDYRARHACYKLDKDLQAAHRQHSFVVIWDDHEVANNAWSGGSVNHSNENQGRWGERLSAAVKAYYEWMPVREIEHTGRMALYRGYRFGDLLDLSVLDTRLAGRDGPTDDLLETENSDRTLLGFEQEAWLDTRLAAAQQEGVTWKLFGQQVMVSQFGLNEQPFNYDQWDGYPAARNRLFDSVRRHSVNNWVVLTGDIHSSWAMTIHDDPFSDLSTPLGVEFVTPAVTSPGITSKPAAQLAGASLESLLPHLNFVDFYHRGFVLLDITHEQLQAEWWVVDRVDTPRYRCECMKALKVPVGKAELIPSQPVMPESTPLSMKTFDSELAYLREWEPAPQALSDGMLAASAPQ
jgi:alkaline phosphatase D